jgi:hypothetical protein
MSARCCGTIALFLLFPVFALACAQDTGASAVAPMGGQDRDKRLQAEQPARIEAERQNFRALLLGNPNYFGTLKDSLLKPVTVVKLNTKYEEIKCVGYNPDSETLEAVVYIKQTYGYSGDVCTAGSPEFVRFYLSYDNGTTWEDQGMTRFTAYDVPDRKPLEYAATLWIDPPKRPCLFENLPRVRAILSWNRAPTPDTPDYAPVWGNVVEANIQIDAWAFSIPLGHLFKEFSVKLPVEYKGLIDLSAPVAVKKPAALGLSELHGLYAKTTVPPHRYLYEHVEQAISTPWTAELMIPAPDGDGWPPVPPEGPIPPEPPWPPEVPGLIDLPGIDWPEVIAELLETKGDTKYEELTCVGLDTTEEALVGVLQVKLPSGYSGGLCTRGSTEYVGFWVDWGAGWEPAGIATVNTHDIRSIPSDGLMYSVYLPVNLDIHRQPCGAGAKTAKVRAILSWNVPPTGPYYDPRWGNAEETLVHIPPGAPIDPTDHRAFIDSLSGVHPCSIDQSTGYATGEKPFGKRIRISGFILNPPDVSSPDPFRYRVSVRPRSPTGAWQHLSNSFNIDVTEQTGTGAVIGKTIKQEIQSDEFYIYRDDPDGAGGGWRCVRDNVLAYWNTTETQTGLWEIRLQAKQGALGTPYDAATVVCVADGTTRSTVKVFLDQARPQPALQITGFSRAGGPVEPAVDCGTFQVGDVIHGTYSVADEHFRMLTLVVKPAGPAGGATVSPSARWYPTVPTTGESGTWTLDTSWDTKDMDPCGYIVELDAWDRTIVSGDHRGWWKETSVGFCLEEAP